MLFPKKQQNSHFQKVTIFAKKYMGYNREKGRCAVLNDTHLPFICHFFERNLKVARLEKDYQMNLIARIEDLIPNCLVEKNDPNYIQGIPDLTICVGPYFAVLEVKRGPTDSHQPNQDWYIQHFKDTGAFASFVYPENEARVLTDLYHYFEHKGVL